MKKLFSLLLVLVMVLGMIGTVWAATPPADAVAQVGDYYYTTLTDAVTYALSDQTVTLLKDVELTERLTVASGKTVTLDLAGYTLTLPKAEGVIRAILIEGALTVNDSSAEKTGTIVSDKTVFQNWGTLVVNSGTFEGGNAQGQCALANGFNDQDPASPKTNAKATINGGVFKGAIPVLNFGTTTVKDGTFIGSSIVNPLGTLTINGGEFDVSDLINEEGAKMVISGGYFNADPSAYVAAGKRAVAANKDGYTWMIADKRTSRPHVGTGNSASAPTDQTVTSAKTFDAGIAVYGVMALMSAAGAAYVGKKR